MDREHLSIQEVYEGTGISRNTISQLYNGKSKGIQFETLTKLVEYLDVEPEELFAEKIEYTRLEPSIELEDVVNEIHSLQDISKALEEDNLVAFIGFSNPVHNAEKYRVLDFKIPVFLSYDSVNDNLAFFTDEEQVADYNTDYDFFHGDDGYYETANKISKLVAKNSAGKIENIFAQTISELTKAFNFDTYSEFIGYSCSFGGVVNYLWNSNTLLNKDNYKKYINAKYPSLDDQHSHLFRYF